MSKATMTGLFIYCVSGRFSPVANSREVSRSIEPWLGLPHSITDTRWMSRSVPVGRVCGWSPTAGQSSDHRRGLLETRPRSRTNCRRPSNLRVDRSHPWPFVGDWIGQHWPAGIAQRCHNRRSRIFGAHLPGTPASLWLPAALRPTSRLSYLVIRRSFKKLIPV